MAAILINVEVGDFNTWLKVFEGNDKMRSDAGVKSATAWRAADNPNNIFVLVEHDDLNKIREFSMSEPLRQALRNAGAKGTPKITVLEYVARREPKQGAAFH